MIRYEKFVASELSTPGRSGLMSRSAISSAVHRLEPVAEELGVEPDLEGVAGERHRQRLLRLADVLRLGGDRQLALGEAQPQRRVALGHHRGAPDDLEELLARQRHLVLEALGQQLLVVRELSVDPPRREPDVVRGEDDLVVLDADLESSPPARSVRARPARARGRSPRARAASPDRVSLTDSRYESVAAMTSLPPSKRTRMPVSTGRDSSRDAARRRAQRSRERGAVELKVCARLGVGQPREVLGAVRVQPVVRRPGRDLEHALLRPVLDATSLRGAVARCRQQPAGNDDRALALDLRSSELRSDSSMSVAASFSGPSRREQDPAEDLNGARVEMPGDDGELLDELVLRAGDLHADPVTVSVSVIY